MSTTTTTQHSAIRNLLVIVSMLLLAIFPESRAFGAQAGCDEAVPILLNETFVREYPGSDAKDLYVLSVPEPGFALIHVTGWGLEGKSSPNLFLLDPASCRESATPRLLSGEGRLVTQAPRSLLLRLDSPQELWVGIAPEDPRLSLDAYQVQVRYLRDSDLSPALEMEASEAESCEEGAFTQEGHGDGRMSIGTGSPGARPTKDVEPEECDILDGLTSGPIVVSAQKHGFSWLTTDSSFETAWLAWSDPRGSEGLPELRLTPLDFCPPGEDDGDNPFCVAPLVPAKPMSGLLRSDVGVDQDRFGFTLTAQSTVELEIDGADRIALESSSGQRLLEGRAGEEGGHLRWVRTLGPGMYHLAVSGHQRSKAAYSVSFRTLDPR